MLSSNEFKFYAINCETGETSSIDKEYFDTFQDAMNNRFKYANWWCNSGDVWIKEYIMGGNNLTRKVTNEWHIGTDGRIISHYTW